MKTIVAAAACALAAPALAQTCTPAWEVLPNTALNAGVEALLAVEEPGGPALYVGGSFTDTGIPARRIARYDGVNWAALGEGIPEFTHGLFGCCAKVHSLAIFDDGSGPALHIGGDFIIAGTTLLAESITKWQNGDYHSVGGGLVGMLGCSECPPRAYAMVTHNDGSGQRLFVAGGFQLAGATTANHAAAWDGAAWSDLDGGFASSQPGQPTPSWINELTVYQGMLHAAGQFTDAGATRADSIARWNGAAWQALGAGLGPNGPKPPFAYGNAMAIFEDDLYVGGEFTLAGGQPARNVARWDGNQWSSVGTPLGQGVDGQVRSMAVFDDGTGPALYVGGDFTQAGGVSASSIARWTGSQWEPVGGGLDSAPYAMEVIEHLGRPYLYVGGWFSTAGGLPAQYLARYAGCEPPCYADCDGDSSLTLADFGCFQTKFALADPYADCDGDNALTLADFGCFQTAFALGCP